MGNAKLTRETTAAPNGPTPSNLGNFTGGKFRRGVLFAEPPTGEMAAFFNHIRDVVVIGAQKQMVWVHAKPVIALMANMQSVRDRTAQYLPTHAVRSRPPSNVAQHAVAFVAERCRP